MKILSWNVAGIRACIKRGSLDFVKSCDYDIICFQETKALESEVVIPTEISEIYPYRYWKSSLGITQRKGLAGTAIWSKTKAIREFEPPVIDQEGRVTALEFPEFCLVTVYTPNSQNKTSERHDYRVGTWDHEFLHFINNLPCEKSVIVSGDFNCAYLDINIYNPEKYKDKAAGFLNDERENFYHYLDYFVDAYREKNGMQENIYTYWDQTRPIMRKNNYGWFIDYFLVQNKIKNKIIKCQIHPEIKGSDHCPISLQIKTRKLIISN